MKGKMKLCCHVAMMKQEKNRGGVNKRSILCFRDRMIESLSFCHAVFLHLEEMENSLPYPKECPRP